MLERIRLELLWFGCWLLVLVGNEILGRGSHGPMLHLYQSVLGLAWYLVLAAKAHRSRREAIATWCSLLAVVSLSLAAALPAMLSNPALSRLATNGHTGERYGVIAAELGVPSFMQLGAYSVLLPAWVGAACSVRRTARILALSGCGIVAAALILSSSAAQGSLLVLGLALFVVVRAIVRSRRPRAIAVVGYAVVLGGIGKLAYDIAPTGKPVLAPKPSAVQSVEFMYEKSLHLLRRKLDHGLVQGDDTGRAWRTELSVRTFSDNPLFGFGPDTALVGGRTLHQGGHAWVIDFLAQYGVVGFAPLLLFLGTVMVRCLASLDERKDDAYGIGCVIALVLFILHGLQNGQLMFEYATPLIFGFMGAAGTASLPTDRWRWRIALRTARPRPGTARPQFGPRYRH